MKDRTSTISTLLQSQIVEFTEQIDIELLNKNLRNILIEYIASHCDAGLHPCFSAQLMQIHALFQLLDNIDKEKILKKNRR